jgi:hypothetical protein
LEPEEEPGHFPPKRVSRSHPRRFIDLFREVHYPRLKPENLVETLGDLAEATVHGASLGGVLVMGMWLRGSQLFREVFAVKITIWGVTSPPPQIGHAIFACPAPRR